jgi:hypothetical protein
MMIFYQQVTEGQLIKKEPINEEALRAESGPRNPAGKNFSRPSNTRHAKTKRATIPGRASA